MRRLHAVYDGVLGGIRAPNLMGFSEIIGGGKTLAEKPEDPGGFRTPR